MAYHLSLVIYFYYICAYLHPGRLQFPTRRSQCYLYLVRHFHHAPLWMAHDEKEMKTWIMRCAVKIRLEIKWIHLHSPVFFAFSVTSQLNLVTWWLLRKPYPLYVVWIQFTCQCGFQGHHIIRYCRSAKKLGFVQLPLMQSKAPL